MEIEQEAAVQERHWQWNVVERVLVCLPGVLLLQKVEKSPSPARHVHRAAVDGERFVPVRRLLVQFKQFPQSDIAPRRADNHILHILSLSAAPECSHLVPEAREIHRMVPAPRVHARRGRRCLCSGLRF
eukprot:8283024-Pyramimonas_sp.AAC.1